MKQETIDEHLRLIARAGSEWMMAEGNRVRVSQDFAVPECNGEALIEVLSDRPDARPMPVPESLCPDGVSIEALGDGVFEADVAARDLDTGNVVGIYSDTCLYVRGSERGRGIGAALVSACACLRGGSVVIDQGTQGFSPEGADVHERAFAMIEDYATCLEPPRPQARSSVSALSPA